MQILYSKAASKTIDGMDRATKQRIKTAIEAIPMGNIKPLTNSTSLYRLRVGGWRIIFTYAMGAVYVEKIASRGDVYKGGLL